ICIIVDALTHVKEKLVKDDNVDSYEKKQAKLETMVEHVEWVLPAHFRSEAKTYIDWVGPALIRHKDSEVLRTEELRDVVLEEIKIHPSEWDISVIHGSELTNIEEPSDEIDFNLKEKIVNWESLPLTNESNLSEQVNQRLSYHYPYRDAAMS